MRKKGSFMVLQSADCALLMLIMDEYTEKLGEKVMQEYQKVEDCSKLDGQENAMSASPFFHEVKCAQKEPVGNSLTLDYDL